ncbi:MULTISPECIES: tRNA uracil 4-sulfurtransferase ThiI [unclassified Thermotoga]|uniref:tRNA uracil 4-sulfurtransferase ThiI n=1 Tax=unclassified Thermotoga TaxID=2631113 RepID=UPI0005428EAC|nr:MULTISPECIES: tRNA uracil 4-sulfurtransferase ThiI [unclassified Thermotoga]KAF2960614.1 thiamine biosynthesis protein ThiI [Thermotoga sp. 38H-to]KHC92390.1 thiamine biosynthesis protein ThiI [Thermotoga sp. Mc24]
MRVYIVRYSEIGLKGKNRKDFEEILRRNIERVTGMKVKRQWGRFLIPIDENVTLDDKLKKIFGIQNFSKGFLVSHDFEEVKKYSLIAVKEKLEKRNYRTFKVQAKKAYKEYEKGVYEINSELGALILKNFKELSVDVHNPDFVLGVEVRPEGVLIFTDRVECYGGLPVGTGGKAVLLLSGGIDSPVAGWYALKRGVLIESVTFVSPPFTSEGAVEKVRDILRVLREFSGGHPLRLHIVNLTKLQLEIKKKVPDKYSLIMYRRSMFRIAEKIAEETDAIAFYTGENIGQVASQTLENLWSIESVTTRPVIRPLSGFDKTEIVEKAKEIGTYEISIKPYQDSCVFFAPKNPATRSHPSILEKLEHQIPDLPALEEEAFISRKVEVIE